MYNKLRAILLHDAYIQQYIEWFMDNLIFTVKCTEAQDKYCIISSCINAWCCLVARIKHTVASLNIQYSTSRIISCHQSSLMASQIINSM